MCNNLAERRIASSLFAVFSILFLFRTDRVRLAQLGDLPAIALASPMVCVVHKPLQQHAFAAAGAAANQVGSVDACVRLVFPSRFGGNRLWQPLKNASFKSSATTCG